MSKIHNFNESNELSLDAKMFPFWESVYFEFFGYDCHISKTVEDIVLQKKGIDRVITLKNGKKYFIDEKVRFSDYNDILLEFISAKEYGTVGWIEKDLNIDYILYAFNKSNICYVLDYISLKRAWRYYGESWKKKYFIVNAINNGYNNKTYTTVSVAVPIKILTKVMQNVAIIDLNKKHLFKK